MIIDCAQYLDGSRVHRGAMTLEEAAARRHGGTGGFIWLGLFEPSPAELDQVRDAFDLHELAVEDAQTFHMRPKIERYSDGIDLVILRTARYDDAREEVDFGEISVFVGPDFVIAVRQGVASELASARARLEQHPELLRLGPASVLWAIMDQVIDGYGPVVSGLEQDIDEVEETVFAAAVAPTERIYLLRREVTNFYRAVHPLLAVLTFIERAGGATPLQPYFRDVTDDLLLVNEEVSAQRDLLATILEANMAVISVEQTRISVRQSATMERLTIMATVFLPLTFVTGFFGQNFSWLTEHINGLPEFLIFGIGGLVLPLVLLWVWLRTDRSRAAPAVTLPPRPVHGATAPPRPRQSVPAAITPHSSGRVAALRVASGSAGSAPPGLAAVDPAGRADPAAASDPAEPEAPTEATGSTPGAPASTSPRSTTRPGSSGGDPPDSTRSSASESEGEARAAAGNPSDRSSSGGSWPAGPLPPPS
jgi:magnesium transporter